MADTLKINPESLSCISEAKKALEVLTGYTATSKISENGPLSAYTAGSTSKVEAIGALAGAIVDREILQPCLNGIPVFKRDGSARSR